MKKKILHLIIVFFSQMLSINAQCTWTGMVDNKWNNAGNWSLSHAVLGLFAVGDDNRHLSVGASEQLGYDLEPHVFASLRKGGAAYGGRIDAIVFQNGRRFANGKPWLPVVFQQPEVKR